MKSYSLTVATLYGSTLALSYSSINKEYSVLDHFVIRQHNKVFLGKLTVFTFTKRKKGKKYRKEKKFAQFHFYLH